MMLWAALVWFTHDISLRIADHHLILLNHSWLSHNDLALFLTPFASLRSCTWLLHTQFAISVSVLSLAEETFLGGRVWGSAAIASFWGASLAVRTASVAVGLVNRLLHLVLMLIVMLLLDHESVLTYQSSSLETFMSFTVFQNRRRQRGRLLYHLVHGALIHNHWLVELLLIITPCHRSSIPVRCHDKLPCGLHQVFVIQELVSAV